MMPVFRHNSWRIFLSDTGNAIQEVHQQSTGILDAIEFYVTENDNFGLMIGCGMDKSNKLPVGDANPSVPPKTFSSIICQDPGRL